MEYQIRPVLPSAFMALPSKMSRRQQAFYDRVQQDAFSKNIQYSIERFAVLDRVMFYPQGLDVEEYYLGREIRRCFSREARKAQTARMSPIGLAWLYRPEH